MSFMEVYSIFTGSRHGPIIFATVSQAFKRVDMTGSPKTGLSVRFKTEKRVANEKASEKQ